MRADEQAVLATQQAHRADMRAREATSRRLAEQADRLAEARGDTALLLMAQAYKMADNTAIRSSWWRLLGRSDLPSTFLPMKAKSIRFEPDGGLELGLGRGSATLRETDGVWRPKSRPNSSNEAVAATLEQSEMWQWSGSCDGDSPVCSCSKSESRQVLNGCDGDQDLFCIASEVKVPGWCSDQPFEVPGVDVRILRQNSLVQINTDLGSGDFACIGPPYTTKPDGGQPT